MRRCELAATSPACLAMADTRWYQLAPHLTLIDDAVLSLARGDTARLMVTMPPRHGKSETLSVYTPAWWMLKWPDRRVILGSYGHDLAALWSRRTQDVFSRWGAPMGLKVPKNHSASDDWGIVGHRGGMLAQGVGGPITGRGGDLLILDDPVKNDEEANSAVCRDAAWDWYRSTFRPRLEPGAAIIAVMTRWHEDDLFGRILAHADEIGERWEVLSLPALAEGDDVLGRQPGEALWPERYSREDLLEKQAASGPYWWSALYQQRPSPAEGSLFVRDWWGWYDELPRCEDQMLSVDCAFKGEDDSDFVVIQVWGRANGSIYLCDQHRERMDFSRTLDAIEGMSAKWPTAHRKLIEDKANGPAVVSALHRRLSGLLPVKPQGGKHSRAAAVQWLVREGKVMLPRETTWVQPFIDECASFPRGMYDDQVDAMSQALLWWFPMRVTELVAEVKPSPLSYEALVQHYLHPDTGFLRPATEARS